MNLDNHRRLSQLTSLVYTVAFGSIIFLVSGQKMIIRTYQFSDIKYTGSFLNVRSDFRNVLTPQIFDPILKANSHLIDEFSFVTADLVTEYDQEVKATEVADFSKINNSPIEIFGVQPNVFEATASGYLEVSKQRNSLLSLGEQLYTPAGSQSIGCG